MATQFLTIRLTEDESLLISRLHSKTGLTKSEIVKRALRGLAESGAAAAEGGLFELGAARFGRHGDVTRQAAGIKQLVRARVSAKRTG